MLVLAILAFYSKMDFFYFQISFLVGLFIYKHINQILSHLSGISRVVKVTIILMLYAGMNLLVKIKIVGPILADIAAVVLAILAMSFLILFRKKIHGFFVKLGETSYSLYLLHFPLLLLSYTVISKMTGKYFFYSRIYYLPILVIVPLNFALFYIFEQPSLRLIGRLKRKGGDSHKNKMRQPSVS